jgi:multidrug efflux system membrane fusion protein
MDDQPPRGYVPPPSAPPTPIAEEAHPPPVVPAEPDELPPIGQPAPPRRPSRLRSLLWLIVLAAIVAAVVWYVLHRQQPAAPSGRNAAGAPMPIGTATVQKGDMPITVAALGTVTPLAMVTVRTQLNGQLAEIGFQEGQMVNKGDFLAQIDPRPYQVALAQAQGQLAKDQAALANAEVDLKRYQTLVAQNSVARQTLDTQVATVAQDKATIQSDQAAIDTQKLNLTYAHIVAPVSGRVGLRQVDAGNYVQTGDTNGLVVITQLQPISVIFTVPEDNLPAILTQLHAGKTLDATALDRSGATKLESGQLATIDNQIDTSTGTVKLRAQFPNAGLNLFPNQFVNVQLHVDTLQNTSLAPSSAIQRGAPGTFVYIVKPDNTVSVQVVTLGPDNGEQVAVTKGLDPGQVIVTDGADRLKDGAKVEVVQPGGQTPGQPGQNPAPHRRGQGQQPGPGQQPGQQNRSNGG